MPPTEPPGEPTPSPTPTWEPTTPSGTATEEPSCVAVDGIGCYAQPRRIGEFDADALPEASGLAVSRRDGDVLYLLDDEPGTGAVHAVRRDGTLIAVLAVEGLSTRDGESLTTGPCGADRPEPWCLFIGDTGDNTRSRGSVVVTRVPEPDLSGPPPQAPLPGDRAELTYPDGAHDAEALLVDDLGRPHIVTKAPFDRETRSTGETRLYRAERFADGQLTDLGVLPLPPPRAPLHSQMVGGGVTGGDLRDGLLLLRTYDAVFAFVAPPGQRDLADIASWAAHEAPAPFELQSEGLAIADGCSYITAGEMAGDLWLVPCSVSEAPRR